VIKEKAGFAVAMAAGSIIGAFVGSLLLGLVDEDTLLPVLSLILVVSAFKVWKHE